MLLNGRVCMCVSVRTEVVFSGQGSRHAGGRTQDAGSLSAVCLTCAETLTLSRNGEGLTYMPVMLQAWS